MFVPICMLSYTQCLPISIYSIMILYFHVIGYASIRYSSLYSLMFLYHIFIFMLWQGFLTKLSVILHFDCSVKLWALSSLKDNTHYEGIHNSASHDDSSSLSYRLQSYEEIFKYKGHKILCLTWYLH